MHRASGPSRRIRAFARPVVALATIVAAGSCHAGGTSFIVVEPTHPAPAATAAVTHAAANDSIVNTRFQNVRFHVWPGVALEIRDLLGRMHSQRADDVVSFDDKRSFVLAIDSGVVGLPMSDLSTLMNTYVFAYRGAPLRDLELTTQGTHLVQRGILHKGIDIPFEMVAEVSATPDGQIRVHPVSMKICSLNGKGLMDALGITLAKMIDVHEAKGVRVEENDLLLDPEKVLPAPAISGHLVGVAVEPGRLVQYFGAGTEHVSRIAMAPDTSAANYILFRGGTLQFGKLFMVHADMQVIDAEPSDQFDFDIGRYREQLVAGYSRSLANGGLLVFMPDLAGAEVSVR